MTPVATSSLNHFVTACSANYLPNVVALHRSLREHCDDVTLRVVALDAESDRLLGALRLPGVIPIPVADVEAFDPALGRVKEERTVAEYAWTLKAPSLAFALEREPDLPIITWLGADLLFFHDTAPMWDDLGDGSVLLVPHNFHPRWDKVKSVGPYNADTVAFRRSEEGMRALDCWRLKKTEPDSARQSRGRFDDQRLLDDWPERFEGVRVAQHPGIGLTSANSPNFRIELGGSGPTVDGQPLIFYHYTSHEIYGRLTTLRRLGLFRSYFELTRHPVPIVWGQPRRVERDEEWELWRTYMERLSEAIALIRTVSPGFNAPFEGPRRDGWRRLRHLAARRARRRAGAPRRAVGRLLGRGPER
jgi:hypothetical protein